MREYGLTLLVAAAVTYLLTPLVRRFAIAVGALHAPRDRDVHTKPTPLLGGLAMYGGLVAGLLVAYRLKYLNSVFAGTRVASGLLLAGGLIMVIGFVDDRWGMGALSKLACQVAAGVILVWSGAFVSWLPAPSGNMYALDVNEQTAVTILVVVVTINAVNFLDGLDGLAAGVVGIGAAAFFLYYYELTKRLHLDAQTGPALVSALLVGVCLGFLPHNFHPARIFMGDSGAHFLGIALGMISILGVAKVAVAFALAVPVIALAVPIADTAWAILRRRRQKTSVATADLLHLHHRLQAFGLDPRQTCYVFYAASALLGALGLTLFGHGRVLAVVVVATAALVSTVAADLLQHAGWRIPVPFMRRLLGNSGTR